MKRFMAFLVAAILLLSACAYAAEKDYTAKGDYIVKATVPKGHKYTYLYDEPSSTQGENLAKVNNGERVYVYYKTRGSGSSSSWAYCKYDGLRGYIRFANLTKSSGGGGSATTSSSGKYDLDNYGYRYVDSKGRGSLVFQKSPRGKSMPGHKFYTGDKIYVNLKWREDGYAIAYEHGEYGYVDASYINWGKSGGGSSGGSGSGGMSSSDKNLSNFEYKKVRSKGRGSLVFQKAPRGKSMSGHKFYDGDWIYVNVKYRKDGYTIAYEDGEYGFVDASYIDWSSSKGGGGGGGSSSAKDLSKYEYRRVRSKGRGSLVFQKEPRGKSIPGHKFYDGDWIYVNVKWRKDGYAMAYEDGVYGYVDASYIEW